MAVGCSAGRVGLTYDTRPRWGLMSVERVEPFAYGGVLSADFHVGGTA